MWTFALALALLSNTPDTNPTVAHWGLDGSLGSAVGGGALGVSSGDAVFVESTGLNLPDERRKVLALPPGTSLRVPLAFSQSGPGYQGRWAVILDVRVTAEVKVKGGVKRATWSEVPLVQTDLANNDSAEMALTSTRGLEVAGERGGRVELDGWHRVAMVVDEVDGTVTGFIDGVMTRRVKTTVTDSRWALEPELILFADNKRSHPGLEVAGVQVRVGGVTSGLVEKMGGLETKMPLPDVTALAWRRPPPAEVTVGEPFSVAFSASPPAGEVVLAFVPDVAAAPQNGSALARLELGRVPADVGRMQAVFADFEGVRNNASAAQSAGGVVRGRLELTWSGASKSAIGSPVSVRTSSAGDVPAGELLQNPELEGANGVLAGWRVSGNVKIGAVGGASAVSGRDGDFALTQVVALPPGVASGGFGVALRARMKRAERASAFGDRGQLQVKLRDARGQVVGMLQSLIVDGEQWHERVILGPIPAGATEAEVAVIANDRQGQMNSVMVDRVSFELRRTESRPTRLSKLPLVLAQAGAGLSLILETDTTDLAPRVEVWRVDDPERALVGGVGGSKTTLASAVATAIATTIDARHQVHLVPLPELAAGVRHAYRVVLGDEVSETWELVGPSVTGRLKMAWLADNQHGWQTFRTLVPRLRTEAVDQVFVAGDIVQHGHKLREWQTEWFSPLSIDDFGQTTPLLVARGNHDANGAFAHVYAPLPGNGHWFAYSRNGVRFIVLDTEASATAVPAQVRWLENELASEESRQAEFRVVAFHKAPFSNRWDRKSSTYNGESWVRAHFVPVFERFAVDLVVAGHAHAYQRLDQQGVRYVVVGGAGGRLDQYKTGRWPMDADYVGHHYAVMEVDAGRMSWVAKDFDGKVIDRFELKSRTRALAK